MENPLEITQDEPTINLGLLLLVYALFVLPYLLVAE